MGRGILTLVLAFFVAVATFIGIGIASPATLVSMGLIYPMLVAWAAGSLFALSRQPRHGWFYVAALGVLVAALARYAAPNANFVLVVARITG
jgi:hypothetical protein